MELNLQLASRLKGMREAMGYSLEKLSEVSGVSKTMLFQMEKGEGNPSVNTLSRLAAGLQTTVTSLLGEDPKPVEPSVDAGNQTVTMQETQPEKEGTGKLRTFEKSHKLDNVCYDVRGPVVEEADRMIANNINILKLNIGNTAPFGFHTPDEIIHDMQMNLVNAEGYSDSKGVFSARKAVMQYGQIKKLPNVQINDIYMGNGVSELISMAMQGFLNDGDEILIPSPDYPLWTAAANLAGGKPVHYICDESANWYPDLADMEKKVTSRTKGIVIINPNNPTGALYPKELLEQIAEFARRHDLVIFSDEIYDRLLYDGQKHISIASLCPDLLCVTFNGLSKSHRMPGFRCGWMCLCGDKSRAKGYIEGLNMLSSMRLCANVPAQMIVQTALGGYQSSDELLVPGGRLFEQREFIYKALNDIPGISVVKPQGAFYCFPKIDCKKYNITDDEKFVLDFLHEEKVLLVPGKGFNWMEPDHFRVVYLPAVQDLKMATGRLARFLSSYRG